MENQLRPKQIDLEVTSACNLKCRYCPGLGTKAQHMDFDLFKSIIDRVDFPTTIVPWLNGEPLMHPRYNEMLQCIEDKGLRYYVTTNGMIWRDDVFEIMLEENSNCYQIIVSLDGLASTNSPELARPGTDVRKVVGTIEKLMDNKPDNLDIAVKICRRGQDYEEIETFISAWLKYGVDFVIAGDALVEADNPVGFRQHPCQYSDNNFMVVKVDGRLVRCAYNDKATNDPDYDFGIISKTAPLLEIYNGLLITKFREDQNKGVYQKPCDTCGMAYTGTGMQGEVTFRDPNLIQDTIYYQRDYYNSFFSLKKKRKNVEYYKSGFSGEV